MIEQNNGFQNYPRGNRDLTPTIFTVALEFVDLALECLIVATVWVYRTGTRAIGRRQRGRRPLQVIQAMSMVNDHVLRDVGLDRAAIAAVGELSVEEIDGCRFERAIA